jgi:hypothetical protein
LGDGLAPVGASARSSASDGASGDGPADEDIFDESAIATLAEQPDPVSAPF